MTTVSFTVTPAMAREIAAAAGALGLASNGDVALEATRLLLRSVRPGKLGRPLGRAPKMRMAAATLPGRTRA